MKLTEKEIKSIDDKVIEYYRKFGITFDVDRLLNYIKNFNIIPKDKIQLAKLEIQTKLF